jgi:hypothetical protein
LADSRIEHILQDLISSGVKIDEINWDSVIEEVVTAGATKMLRAIKEDAHSTLAQETAERIGFEERNYAVWKEPLDLLELFLLTTIELGDDFNHKYRPEAAKKQRFRLRSPHPASRAGMSGGPRDPYPAKKRIR